MSIELAEKLKEKLTDKYVVVDKSIPELRRFANWTGKVKTVNMSCRALVEFDGPVDIGWYDINPDYLIVVDGPQPKAAPAAKAPAAKPAAAAAPAAAKPAAAAGKSPLDAIRAQQAAKAAGGAAPATAAPAAGAKLSPMEMIRQQQAAAKAKAAGAVEAAPAAATAAAPAPAPAAETAPLAAAPEAPAAKAALPTTGPDGRPLSKIEMIRMQQAAKKS